MSFDELQDVCFTLANLFVSSHQPDELKIMQHVENIFNILAKVFVDSFPPSIQVSTNALYLTASNYFEGAAYGMKLVDSIYEVSLDFVI